MTRVRHTARGIVVRAGQLLLMERWRPGLHYFSIPGGGIEPGETAEETVVREIAEETTLVVTVERQVLEMRDSDTVHKIYLCQYVAGEPQLLADSPEALLSTADNLFSPRWVPVDELPQLSFTYWQPLQPELIRGLQNGFPSDVTIVSAAQTS